MSDTEQAIATLTAYAASCHDEIAQAGARLVAAYAELEKLAYGDPTEDELEADRVAIQRSQERLASDLRAAEERGRVTTRIEWRGYLRKAIGRERELRDANAQLEKQVQAQVEEVERLRFVRDHASQAIAILSTHSATRAGMSLPEAVQAIIAENGQLEMQVRALEEEIARLRAIIAAAVQVSAERGEQGA